MRGGGEGDNRLVTAKVTPSLNWRRKIPVFPRGPGGVRFQTQSGGRGRSGGERREEGLRPMGTCPRDPELEAQSLLPHLRRMLGWAPRLRNTEKVQVSP